MGRQQHEYTISRSPHVRQLVRFVTDGKEVLDFTVQLEVESYGKWTWCRRYDTSNGEAHLDVKKADGTEEHHIPLGCSHNDGLTIALGELQDKWHRFCDWYLGT